MRNLIKTILIALLLAGCVQVGQQALEINEKQVDVCVRFDGIRVVHPLPGGPFHLRWYADLTIVSIIEPTNDSGLATGDRLRLYLHSPSRQFGESDAEVRGKIYRVKLSRTENNWSFIGGAVAHEGNC
jgi:hypothetical protein